MIPADSAPLPVPAPGIMYQALDDGAVLLAPATEVYFGLNHVGAAVWEHLPPARATFGELCAAVRAAYPDASADAVRQDAARLLDELAAAGLVAPPPAP